MFLIVMFNLVQQPRFAAVWRGGAPWIVLATMLAALGCSDPPLPMPEELLGMWRSDHERYRDRTFEIREDAVLFGTGEFKAAAFHSIVGVEPIARNDEPGVKSWRVIYRDADDGTDSMELVFREHPAPRLRFASREDWWRRAPQGGKDE